MTEREALRLALETFEELLLAPQDVAKEAPPAITAIREVLAQPEQQPVAHSVVEPLRHDEYQRRVSVKWVNQPVAGPLYTTPPQRKELEATEHQVEVLSDDLSKCSKALRLALEALEDNVIGRSGRMPKTHEAITAIREVLPQPEQEPVAYPEGDVVGPCICGSWPGGKCLKCPRITTPPQRTWVGLTDKEVREAMNSWSYSQRAMTHAEWVYAVQRATEAKLKEKNT